MAAKIRTKDTVIVLTGKDKGQQGEVLSVSPADQKAIVRGINVVKRHTKATMQSAGGIVSKEKPIHLSNLALIDPKTKKPTRVGFKTEGERKVRFAKASGTVLD